MSHNGTIREAIFLEHELSGKIVRLCFPIMTLFCPILSSSKWKLLINVYNLEIRTNDGVIKFQNGSSWHY